ncbi:hypothetical protein Tco_1030458 [Tanacetum coccineum]|uniref:Uncharacterized protein n=1 Tax=Tanacetum coccineum TaxID=301880 RepID=A0ABQ5G841_9ASTR
MSEFRQTSQFAEAVSLISGIVDTYIASKMKEAVDVVVQLQINKLREEAQAENQEFLNQIDSTMKAIIKEQVQAQVSKIMPKIEKYVTQSLGAKVLVRSTNQAQTSYVVATSLSEFELKKILIDKIETNKSIDRSNTQKNLYNALVESYNTDKDIITSYGDVASLTHAEIMIKKAADLEDQPHQEFNTGNEGVSPVREALNEDVWHRNPSGPPTPDREWHKTKTIDNRPPQPWIIQMAQAAGTQSSFNEFLATPIDFSAFIMHRLKIDNLTQEATNDRLDWHNPKGKPYPHDLSKPLPLIQNEQGRQTKAADYGHVKWIEDKVPRSIWSPAQVVYDKHAYWGTYHWGPKRQRFYGYATNMETSKDVYSRHRIIAVTSLKIMEFFGYKHLEEITVRRQDDQLYRFREGDFKRLRRQDIEDMLLLLVQGKLTNLNLDERFALNVALRMYTRCIVIQERVEDLQLAVESYQKKINISIPDSYHSDLRKMTPYTTYHDIQGIIYQDDMDRNRLMRTDELHKFSDGTLNHVRTALNDIDTGIQMEYLPKRKWNKQDKQRARVMINAIDKKLRDRRLMRSLEKFVGGRPYGGDLRMLQRTI